MRTKPKRPAVPRKRKHTYHHGDLRRALVTAALEIIETAGIDAMTLREAARLVGVSHQAPYRYFPDRGALLAAVAEDGFRELKMALAQAVKSAKDARAVLRAFAAAYVEFAVTHPSYFRVMFGPEIGGQARTPEISATADAIFGMLAETILAIKPPRGKEPPNPLEVALTAWSSVHGLAALLLSGQLKRRAYENLSPAQLVDMVARTLCAGLPEDTGTRER